MAGRNRRRCLLLLVALILLFILLLPALLKSVLNSVVLPRAMADVDSPLVAGRVEALSYHRVVVSNLMADAGNGVLVRIPRLEAVYAPTKLLRGRVPAVDGRIVSESNVVFEADFSVREVRRPGGWGAKASVSMDSLEIPEHRLVLSNLATACTVQWAEGKVRSLPEQRLTMEQLSVGDLHVDHVRMSYQLEPESVLFMESLELDWCEGQVSLYGVRVDPEMTDISIQLLCAQLSLEQVLAAFGVTDFSAGGELNGRVPVRWKDDGIHIDRGFLFTTPGRGGTFSFGAAEAASAIFPRGSLGEGQVGMVAAALAEFDYDWITMALNSEGENLMVAVEIAGTPVNVLPYEYDSERGTYVKTELRPGRGIRQPMQFKLNLTIPLNRLLCYGSGMNSQWNLFKAR